MSVDRVAYIVELMERLSELKYLVLDRIDDEGIESLDENIFNDLEEELHRSLSLAI